MLSVSLAHTLDPLSDWASIHSFGQVELKDQAWYPTMNSAALQQLSQGLCQLQLLSLGQDMMA